MRIPENTVQEILETARVEDIIQEFVTLKRRGVNLIGLCPFHNEKTPSFTVSPSKNLFKCFGCGKGGNAASFLMEHEHMSYPEALRYLAKRYGIEIEEREITPQERAKMQRADSLSLVNKFALDYYTDQLFNTDMGKSIGLSYFKKRGFSDETIRKFGLGYAPNETDAFTKKAVSKGYNGDTLKDLGLTTQYGRDFFRNRVIFPIFNLSGKVVAFAGRIMAKDVKAPKYMNSPETEVYHKSKILYGANFAKTAIRKLDECLLVEGYTDVISLHQAGIEHVVATSGTSLTVQQIGLIKRYTPNATMLFDGDVAGIKAALRGVDMLLVQDLNVKIVVLPEGEDPDSYIKSVGQEAFLEYLKQQAKDFILFKADLLMKEAGNDTVKKANAIKDIVQSIAKVPDPLKRNLFIKECTALFQLTEELLINETNKAIAGYYKKKTQQKEMEERRAARHQQQISQQPHSDFPTETPPAFGDDHLGEMPPEMPMDVMPPTQQSISSSGHEFQEKDIARILIAFGGQVFDEEDGLTVAAFILGNIEDVMDDFDSPLYQSIIEYTLECLSKEQEISHHLFLQHPDQNIVNFAVNTLTSPYEYSENWANKYDVYLNQKAPDMNFVHDSKNALMRFRFYKINRMCSDNVKKIQEMSTSGDSELITLLKMQRELLEIRNELAKELGIVVS